MDSKNSFYSYSFGCRVNEAEKEEIDRKMVASGFSFDPKNPSVYIVNTCSVTNKAEREARQLVYQVKKTHPDIKIVVTGCAATYWQKNNIYKNLPIDLLVDNVNKEFLVDLIRKRLLSKTKSSPVADQPVANKFLDSGRAMIKIQDGCQRFCTFCIVPYLRGTPKSYKIEDIVEKINETVKVNKLSEVILTAINTEAFGYDTNERFIDLVQAVIDRTAVKRISFGSIHPWSINEDFFEFYKRNLKAKRVVNFFHIPLQSGSNKTLLLMKRGYTREEFVDKLARLEALNPMALIATDVIVGFLEESDQDFQDTYDFLKSSPINKFHVFRFSKRTKTAASYMAKRLREPNSSEKAKRAKALIELGQKKYEAFQKKNVGRVTGALFLKKMAKDYQETLIDNQLPVFVPVQPTRLTEAGTIRNIKIIEFKKGKLFGKIV